MSDAHIQPSWVADAQAKREGRYVMGPRLGKGAMGEVFEAWDTVLGRTVALKLLMHLEPAAMIRFMQEAQLHARLDCPNICRIYDVDACNGTPRIAMQLVRGPTLEDAAADLRLEEILALIIQVADAMHAAHQIKLIHRDIKPGNILLQWTESGRWAPYVCDFGLAMALDGPSVTQPLAMTGTPAYMAPEQVRGDRSHICPATDVYGIGGTLYFALTGRPPCVSTVTAEVLRVKREIRFPSPRSLEPEIPADLESILLKCLQPNPADRYASTLELADDLRRFQAGQSIKARSGERPMRIWRWIQKTWPLLAVSAAGVGLCFGLIRWQHHTQRRQARQMELGHRFSLESATLEQNLSNERKLPVHDLRPAYARVRSKLEALRAASGSLGPEAEGPLHFALGRTLFFLRDEAAARAELDQAWHSGYRTPDGAFLLARLQTQANLQAAREAAFHGQAAPSGAASQGNVAEWFRQSHGMVCDPPEFAEALQAYGSQDHPRAVSLAQACLEANPWHLDSATLASLSLSALAAKKAGQGDAAGAQACYTEAQQVARTALARGPSEEALNHAYAESSLGLAALALERGELSPASLEQLEYQLSQQLILNTTAPEAQSDWLRGQALKVSRKMRLGQDPRQTLFEALQFYWTHTQEPRTLSLRVDHMVLYYLLAQWTATHGQDPASALAEALKDPGHALGYHRDFYADLISLKARQ